MKPQIHAPFGLMLSTIDLRPLLVGAGLTFADITDWCGTGMLIAKMPWNQCGDSTRCVKK